MSKKKISIPNISCGHCTRTIEMELLDINGVTHVKTDLASKNVTIEWEEPATWEQIKAKLEEINYPPAE